MRTDKSETLAATSFRMAYPMSNAFFEWSLPKARYLYHATNFAFYAGASHPIGHHFFIFCPKYNVGPTYTLYMVESVVNQTLSWTNDEDRSGLGNKECRE